LTDTTLAGSLCTTCGRGSLLGGPYCPFGCGRTLVDAAISADGEVYASTVVTVPAGQLPTPHQVGYVDLPHDVRVFGHFEDATPVAPETPVRVHRQDVADGAPLPYVRYRFSVREHGAA
jgi:uncharacterized OB-fold protein